VSSAAERVAVDIGSEEALGTFLLMLRARGFRDKRLVNAVEKARRTGFVPLPFVGFAYQEMALPLPCGQQATAPMAVIEAVSQLQIETKHRVLEIGTGSGWQTAILASLAKAVASVERFRTLAEEAEKHLQALDIGNVVIEHADGTDGLPVAGPFDRIIVNAAIGEVSPVLKGQLANGGLLLAPVIGEGGQVLCRYEKRGNRLIRTVLGPSQHAPLIKGAASFL
jgi:protein-L-isoaspartate(D-aspartate) O-methyltransferase